ncbi:MAG: tetratricopeptide repeat protein [Cyclobacteriaceae bacterium]
MRPIILFIAVICAASFVATAQTIVRDSLQDAYALAKTDTARINILLELSKEYELSDSTGLKISKRAYQLSKTTNVENLVARSETALGLFYFEIGNDSGSLLLENAISRYQELGLQSKIADVFWNMSLAYEARNNYDSAIYYLQKSLALSNEIGYEEGAAEANYSLGFIHNLRGKNSLALKHSIKAKEYYKKEGMQLELSDALNQMGIIYDYMGLFAEALDNYLQAREITVALNDTQSEVLIINNLGITYDNMGNSELALQYYEEALEKSGIFHNDEDEATLLNNISYIYLEQGDTLKAKTALWRALKISVTSRMYCFDSYPLEGLGAIYVSEDQLDSASQYLEKALVRALTCEDAGMLTTIYKSLGELFEKRGEFTSALKTLNKSLQVGRKAALNNDVKETLLVLYNLEKRRGNTSGALQHLEAYRLLADSLQKAKNVEKANQLVAEYEFRKKVEDLRAQQLVSEMALEEEIATQNRERLYILLALILVFLLLLTLGRSYYLIQKRNKTLKWLNEEKNTLMGVVAHDLRNPLNMIKGLMQLVVGVKTTEDDENSEKYLHLIKMSTQKMTDMIDKVLDISAIENMKVNLNISKENLTQLLNRASENFEFMSSKKNIEIVHQYDNQSFHMAEVDAGYFEQIMDNLISNGIKFSDPGKKLYLSIIAEGGFHIVSVKDEGPGIGEEEQKSLFNKFKTLAAKPTSNEKSTGLGLSIVKKFVTAMSGEISYESELGKGTTFYLKFKAV